MNILYVNKQLYKFKIIESPLCLYCKTEKETIEHLFVNCSITSTLYRDITIWLKYYGINLPNLHLITFVVGSNDKENAVLIDFLLLLYRSYIYNNRGKFNQLIIEGFKRYVKLYERIEYNIAKKNNRELVHLTKFNNLQLALNNV